MIKNFKIVKVNPTYCNYLRKFDNKVPYNEGIKELRPFIGILFTVNTTEYFAPLSSPKAKHINLNNTIDLVKIDNSRYGVVNFNNMIPVNNSNYELFDLNSIPKTTTELNRQNLLKAQLRWLNNNIKLVKGKAIRLYNLYRNNKLPKSVLNRCCNFPLLEERCSEYNNNIKEVV